ncbi:hypothetical protein OSH36_12620, partial [Mycobacterium ulcerans]
THLAPAATRTTGTASPAAAAQVTRLTVEHPIRTPNTITATTTVTATAADAIRTRRDPGAAHATSTTCTAVAARGARLTIADPVGATSSVAADPAVAAIAAHREQSAAATRSPGPTGAAV